LAPNLRGAHEKEPIHRRADVTVLREADKTSVAEAAKKHKVSEPTIYAWCKHFGQMEAADVKRLKALEIENSRLKKLTTMNRNRLPASSAPDSARTLNSF